MFHCRHDSHISQQEEGNVDERQWPFEPAQHNSRKNVGWISRFYCHVLRYQQHNEGKTYSHVSYFLFFVIESRVNVASRHDNTDNNLKYLAFS
jgi:hypothetical protein